ncbi:MAG: hypothetical protein ACLTMP_07745 [Eggerthella lenta]
MGDNAVISYLVLPGESAVYAIEGDARLLVRGWQISAMPLGLAIDLAEQDTAQLSDKTSELEDATARLSDGGLAKRAGVAGQRFGRSRTAPARWRRRDGLRAAPARWRAGRRLQAGVGAAVDRLASVSANSAALDAAAEQVRAGRPTSTRACRRCGRATSRSSVVAAAKAGRRRRRAVRGRTEAYAAAAAAYADPTAATVAALDGAVQACPASQAAGSYARSTPSRKLCAAVGRHRRGGGRLGSLSAAHGAANVGRTPAASMRSRRRRLRC